MTAHESLHCDEFFATAFYLLASRRVRLFDALCAADWFAAPSVPALVAETERSLPPGREPRTPVDRQSMAQTADMYARRWLSAIRPALLWWLLPRVVKRSFTTESCQKLGNVAEFAHGYDNPK